MPERPHIPDDTRGTLPTELRRHVLIEAGHRCAIPTCKQVPVEVAHIVPWSQCKEHQFENLIALCPTCHTRYDRADIDRVSMKRYKANLSVINSRYGDFERRVLQIFAEHPHMDALQLSGDQSISLLYLLKDGLLIGLGQTGRVIGNAVVRANVAGIPATTTYAITTSGRDFIQTWLQGNLDRE